MVANATQRGCVCDVGCIIWYDSMGGKMFLYVYRTRSAKSVFLHGGVPTVKLFYVTNIYYI